MAGLLPEMTKRQQLGAAILCLTVVGIVFLGLIWIGIAAVTGTLIGNTWPGVGLLLLMNDDSVATAGKWVPAVLGVGAGCLAQSKSRDWLFAAVIALCAGGALLSLILLIGLKHPHIVHQMIDLSEIAPLTDPTHYKAGVNWLFAPLAVWLCATLAAQLGIKLTGERG